MLVLAANFLRSQLGGGLQPFVGQVEDELAVLGSQLACEPQALFSVLSAVRTVHRRPQRNEHRATVQQYAATPVPELRRRFRSQGRERSVAISIYPYGRGGHHRTSYDTA